MMPPQVKGSTGISHHTRELQQQRRQQQQQQQEGLTSVVMEEAEEQQQWECRCTLLNGNSFSRCVACGSPKPRQLHSQQQQHGSGGRASPSLVPDGSTTPATTIATGVAEASGGSTSSEATPPPPATTAAATSKRGRKRHGSGSAGQHKRAKALPGAAAADRPSSVSEANADSRSRASSTAAGSERKRAGSGPSLSSSSKGNGNSRDAKSSAAPAAAAAATSGEEGDGGGEGAPALAEAKKKHAMEIYRTKRKSVGAALARSAFSQLELLSWEDVNVDWCPGERLAEAERRNSALLVEAGAGAKARDGGGRGQRGGAAAAAAAAAGGAEADGEKEELCMSALFPLPQPKPARFVKKGVFATESGAATAAAARPSTTVVAPSPPRPHGTITEGEVLAGKLAGDDAGKPPKTAGGAEGGGTARAISASDGGGSTSSDTPPPAQAAASEGGAKAGAGGDNTDSNNSDKSATTASESSSSTTQYAMTAAARTKAYKGIFRTGGVDKPKKRPRSPVASTPLHLPFPRAPAGVSLATADLEERPPCGSEEYVQTEAGSEWAWGLLGGQQDGEGVASGSGGVGGAAAGASGESGGPRHRDFRLPYDVIYDCHYQKFLGEMRQLGMRSADDAMTEFKGITSNVYLSKKPPAKDVGEGHRCGCVLPSDGTAGCTEACSNRATFEECAKRTCGLEGKGVCGNRKIQRYKQEYMRRKVCIKDVGPKGIGLVAKARIPVGALIGEYVGEVMSEDQWQERQALLHADEKHKFVMDLGESEVIDASQKGSILRFVNHSCGPNAETQKWMIQGKRRIGLFATEAIEKGVEVSW
ncbi:unnamed protein product, partial [Ectocarpus fasciculatus]